MGGILIAVSQLSSYTGSFTTLPSVKSFPFTYSDLQIFSMSLGLGPPYFGCVLDWNKSIAASKGTGGAGGICQI